METPEERQEKNCVRYRMTTCYASISESAHVCVTLPHRLFSRAGVPRRDVPPARCSVNSCPSVAPGGLVWVASCRWAFYGLSWAAISMYAKLDAWAEAPSAASGLFSLVLRPGSPLLCHPGWLWVVPDELLPPLPMIEAQEPVVSVWVLHQLAGPARQFRWKPPRQSQGFSVGHVPLAFICLSLCRERKHTACQIARLERLLAEW